MFLKTLQVAAIVLASLTVTVSASASEWTFEQAAATPSVWREVPAERLILMKTTKGDVLVEVAPQVAPRHVEQVLKIVRSGQYDGTAFHRVIDGFMAQGGDVAATHPELPEWPGINAEFVFRRDPSATPIVPLHTENTDDAMFGGYLDGFPVMTRQPAQADFSFDQRVETWMPHCPGVTSMARTNDPNSAKDQFFLMRDTSEFLDGKYTSWGRMLSGLKVVRSLNVGEPPTTPDLMVFARVVADMPEASRPRAFVMLNSSSEFRTLMDTVADGSGVCAAPATPSVVKIP